MAMGNRVCNAHETVRPWIYLGAAWNSLYSLCFSNRVWFVVLTMSWWDSYRSSPRCQLRMWSRTGRHTDRCASQLPVWAKSISGVILHWETLFQEDATGKAMVDIIKGNGMIPGIKVDKGYNKKGIWGTSTGPLGHPEVATLGLDDLQQRCQQAYKDPIPSRINSSIIGEQWGMYHWGPNR